MVPEPLTFAGNASDGYELRRDEALIGRIASWTAAAGARAEAGTDVWLLTVDGDREALAATWQVVARDEAGEIAAHYVHGSMRGGPVRTHDGLRGSLRRQLGLSVEWRFRLSDAAVRMRSGTESAGGRLDLEYVAGSADIPVLVLLQTCWAVMNEEGIEPARAPS